MFSQFQNMFDKIKTSVTQKVPSVQENDYANTPQKYNINGRQIQQIKLLSQGAFGFIWLAEDIKTKQKFALKRVICMTDERFRQSKKQKDVMSLLPQSKNIVRYYGGDILNRGGQKVVITLMELCDGGTLFDLLQSRQNKGFLQHQLVRIMTQILQGLESIHTTGYYHLDVKIENVLHGADRNYKLCDFGSCTNQVYNFSNISKKQYDNIKENLEAITTPMYRPPQIVDPYARYTVDYKADVWMAGCILYTLSYFTHPFVDSNAIGISSGTYRFPKYPDETSYKVTDKIKDLIRHMLTPNPAYRPSPNQVLQILRNWDNLNNIPLNSQAVTRKKQQLIKQQELQLLNKKTVQFDGDIPIQKLMQLQKKLKGSNNVEEKPSSFINTKATQKLRNKNTYTSVSNNNIKQNQNTFQQKNQNAQNNPFNMGNLQQPKPVQNRIQKKQANFNDIWGQGSFNTTNPAQNNTVQKNTDAFDFFNSFGGGVRGSNPTKISQKQPSKNQLNFDQMFADTKSSREESKNISKNTQDLLDL